MVCVLIAPSPFIGAALGFIYGPGINRTLARLWTKNDAAQTAV